MNIYICFHLNIQHNQLSLIDDAFVMLIVACLSSSEADLTLLNTNKNLVEILIEVISMNLSKVFYHCLLLLYNFGLK